MKVEHNQALIKPVSALCPMRCSYCFYHDLACERSIYAHPKMSLETLDLIFDTYTNNALYSTTFLFQGGEPLLAQDKFYAHYLQKVRKLKAKRPNFYLNSSIQTSGILLTDNLCQILKEANFLVGISLDGPQSLHDANRKLKNGQGSFEKVMQGIKLLEKHQLNFNLLCVINPCNVNKAQELLEFFRQENFNCLQFIPALASIKSHNCLISDEEYADFMVEIFKFWYQDFLMQRYVSVRFFDDLFATLLGSPATSCDLQGHCTHQHVIEADGSIYPCDFYVLDKYKISSIFTPTLQNTQTLKEFLKPISLYSECKTCNLTTVCHCGCKRYLQDNGQPFLCKTYQKLFKTYQNEIQNILQIIKDKKISKSALCLNLYPNPNI